MKSKAFKIETVYYSVWNVFFKEDHFLTRTNYGVLNVQSTLDRIYDF